MAGRVSDKKGVSLPDTTIPTSAMTDKDRADLAAALEEDIDWIALSFVQRPEDIVEVKTIAKGRALVMAKIEKPQAVQRIDEIMAVADAVMVARGDLGVEMPLERVPGIQKTLTRLARRLGKPVVVATQMLELMITAPVPTRAEVSDVATAVFEGADAVMLSAESASGQYPREAVATMNRIAEAVESEGIYPSIIEAQRAAPEATGADAIAEATRDVAETLDLKVICAWTSSGSTGLRIARQRPRSAILALTPIEAVARRLAVVWGVHPIVTDDARDERDMAERACRHAYIEGFAGRGRAHHRRRRRALRHAGRHQQPAHRDGDGVALAWTARIRYARRRSKERPRDGERDGRSGRNPDPGNAFQGGDLHRGENPPGALFLLPPGSRGVYRRYVEGIGRNRAEDEPRKRVILQSDRE